MRVVRCRFGVPLQRGEPRPLDAQVEPSPRLVRSEPSQFAELVDRGTRVTGIAEVEPCRGGVAEEHHAGPVTPPGGDVAPLDLLEQTGRLLELGRGCRPHRPDAARAPPHRCQSCRRGRRQRKGGSADAWSRVSRNDAGRLRGPLRRRPRRSGRRTRPAPSLRDCGLGADQTAGAKVDGPQ